MPQLINFQNLFAVAFGLMLFTTFIMGFFSRDFYTQDVVKKKFSIMDLEIPATQKELANVIRGLYKLPRPEAVKAIKALRWHLYIDFLFMPVAYGAIFLLCMLVSGKMMTYGIYVYSGLAWLQIVPWVCDIIENIYLLSKIRPHSPLSTPGIHKAYLIMEGFKWGIAAAGVIGAISAVCYFWLSTDYETGSLHYLLIIIAEIISFLILGRLFLKRKPAAETRIR